MAKKRPGRTAPQPGPAPAAAGGKVPPILRNRTALLVLAFAGLVVLILAYLLWGGGQHPFNGNTSAYNVLLVTLDTTRADHLGCYGDKSIRTPILDGLSDNGVLFEHAYTAAVMTIPSHTSILTGLLPPAHGIRNNGTSRLRPSVETLAEVLKASGYRTGAVVGAFVLDSMFGLDQGFESYDDYFPDTGSHDILFAERDAKKVTDAALGFLSQVKAGKWFLWVHYYDAHSPYRPPSPYKEEYKGREYDGEIAYVDSELGRLLGGIQEIGARDHTIVIAVADHGEGLRDHGEESHGVFVYDETAHVPMIIQVPGFVEGPKRVPAVVRTIDIMPTIIDLLRLPPRPNAPGTSLWPLIAGQVSDLGLAAYTEAPYSYLSFGWSPLVSLREGKWKFIEAPRREMYDMPADPRERTNLAASEATRIAGMRKSLERIVQDSAEDAKGSESMSTSPEEEAQLRSLGYTGGAEKTKDALSADPMLVLSGGARGLADPKDHVEALEAINRVLLAYGAGDFQAAGTMAQQILAKDPGNLSMRQYLADSYRMRKMFDQALSEYRTILDKDPTNVNVLLNVGYIYMASGDAVQAKATFEKALAAHPGHTYAMASLGNLAFMQGDYDQAVSYYRKVLLKRPNHRASVLAMAKIFEHRGAVREAEVFYKHALDIDPNDTDTLLSLGWLQFSGQKYDDALKTLERAASLDPSLPEISLARGDVLLAQGRLADAEAQYRQGIAKAPQAAQGYHGLGLIAESRGDLASARSYFEQALRANPSFNPSLEQLKRLKARGASGG
jgi:arylsulfatase A-like enzyme/tetratricopeptide (TPR) repeat protein